jgi:hypothetical protein
LATALARRVLGALAPHLLLSTGILCRAQNQRAGRKSTRSWRLTQAPREENGGCEVSGRSTDKGRDGLGRTWNPIERSFDGFDVLSTRATSIVDGFQLLDKLRTGWTSAVDEIHDSKKRGERSPGRGEWESEVKGKDRVRLCTIILKLVHLLYLVPSALALRAPFLTDMMM